MGRWGSSKTDADMVILHVPCRTHSHLVKLSFNNVARSTAMANFNFLPWFWGSCGGFGWCRRQSVVLFQFCISGLVPQLLPNCCSLSVVCVLSVSGLALGCSGGLRARRSDMRAHSLWRDVSQLFTSISFQLWRASSTVASLYRLSGASLYTRDTCTGGSLSRKQSIRSP